MKIVHTSDWHMGRFLNGYSLLEDQEHFLKWLFLFLKEECVDVLIVAGDIYNSAAPSAACVAVLDEFFSKVVLELKKKVVVVAGNHDSPEKLGFSSKILEKSGLYIATTLNDIKTIEIKEKGVSFGITPLPYISLANVKCELKNEKVSNFNETINYVYDVYIKKIASYDFNLLCAHGLFFAGDSELIEFSDSELEIGGCDVANFELFKNFSYVALGHLHRAQNVGKNGRYCGSPIKYSVSEANNKKQLTVIDFCGNNEMKINEVLIEPLRDLKILTGCFDELMKSKTDDFVSIKLTDKEFIIDPYARLKNNYKNILEIEFINLNLDFKESFKVSKKMSPENLFKSFYKFVVGEKIKDVEAKFLKHVIDLVENEKL